MRWLVHRLNPPQMVVFGFAGVILLGSLVLFLPVASAGEGCRYIDALFTATSATCVTGLITRDTPKDWSLLGQVAILVLIQVGGLGIMSLSALVQVLTNRPIGARGRDALDHTLDLSMRHQLRDVIRVIGVSTLAIEALGALVLFGLFVGGGMGAGGAAWHAGFHSVSAFCNAGFSVNSNSFEGYAEHPWVLLTVMLLIVLGGLGFAVHTNLYLMFRDRHRRPGERMSLQTRIVLTMTGALIVCGTGMLYVTECRSGGAWGDRGVGYGLAQAAFQSVSARTAGFNSATIGGISDAGVLVLVILMLIGASPGSTGGGIKTTSLAAILAAIVAMARHRQTVEWGERSIPRMVVYRAMAVGALFLIAVSTGTLVLLVVDGLALRDGLFEAASALGTVGLSTGVTPGLSTAGKVTVILLMFAGRVGPLTLVVSLGSFDRRGGIEYPEAPVAVG